MKILFNQGKLTSASKKNYLKDKFTIKFGEKHVHIHERVMFKTETEECVTYGLLTEQIKRKSRP